MSEILDINDAWQKLVAEAWSDPALKAKLLADPVRLLKANGVAIPGGATVKILQDTDRVLNLVVPVKPVPQELSEEELHQAAGGIDPYRDNDPNDAVRVPPGTYRDNDPNDAARN